MLLDMYSTIFLFPYIKSFINKNKFIDVLEDEVVGFKEKKGEIVKAILKNKLVKKKLKELS